MAKPFQWSISRTLMWMFVAALIASHIANFYQRQLVGFTNFAMDDSDIRQWLVEFDSTVFPGEGEGALSSSGDSVNFDSDCSFISKNSTPQQLLDQLRLRIRQRFDEEDWSIEQNEQAGHSFNFRASKGHTSFRVYCWLIPPTESAARSANEYGGEATHFKILRVGYLMP